MNQVQPTTEIMTDLEPRLNRCEMLVSVNTAGQTKHTNSPLKDSEVIDRVVTVSLIKATLLTPKMQAPSTFL